MAIPPVFHDKCDVQLLDEFVVCEMNGENLECALNKCTGDKFKCDCNVYSKFVHFYDESACRWVKTEQEPCKESSDQSISISSTIFSSTIATTAAKATTRTTTTKSTTTTTSTTTTSTTTTTTTKTTSTTPFLNQTAILIEIQDSDVAEILVDHLNGHSGDYNDNETDLTYDPHRESCKILDSDWICSNGSINLSLCFKICSDDATEHKRCICKEGSCSWYQKGGQCTMETTSVQNWTSPTNSDAFDNVFSTINQSNLSTEDLSGNSGFTNFPSLDSKMDLMSLIHQINVNSSGNINVSFQLK